METNGDKKLYRSNENKILVCEGLGDYLKIDSVIIRVLLLLLAALSDFIPAIIAYIIAIFIIPVKQGDA